MSSSSRLTLNQETFKTEVEALSYHETMRDLKQITKHMADHRMKPCMFSITGECNSHALGAGRKCTYVHLNINLFDISELYAEADYNFRKYKQVREENTLLKLKINQLRERNASREHVTSKDRNASKEIAKKCIRSSEFIMVPSAEPSKSHGRPETITRGIETSFSQQGRGSSINHFRDPSDEQKTQAPSGEKRHRERSEHKESERDTRRRIDRWDFTAEDRQETVQDTSYIYDNVEQINVNPEFIIAMAKLTNEYNLKMTNAQ